jgi:hypothetical protein
MVFRMLNLLYVFSLKYWWHLNEIFIRNNTVACRPVAVNISRCQVVSTRNNRGGFTIRDAYSRCYVAPAAYACGVQTQNK